MCVWIGAVSVCFCVFVFVRFSRASSVSHKVLSFRHLTAYEALARLCLKECYLTVADALPFRLRAARLNHKPSLKVCLCADDEAHTHTHTTHNTTQLTETPPILRTSRHHHS